MQFDRIGPHDPQTVSVFLDGQSEPLATYRPPARFTLDTTQI
jgi:hypothetical protein